MKVHVSHYRAWFFVGVGVYKFGLDIYLPFTLIYVIWDKEYY
jgi:hypothetical protein